MHLPTLIFSVAVLVFHSIVFGQNFMDKVARDEVAYMESEDPIMRKAFKQARDTLDEFLRKAVNPAKNTSNYALKVAVSDGRNTEYFWVGQFKMSGTGFSGELGNEPRDVKKYKMGERFSFSRAQIADWVYMDDRTNSLVGNFTACALLTKETAADAQAFKQRYGLKCD